MSRLAYGQLGDDLSAVAVIMAGGSGTRFWPLSRKARPKQFLPLGGGKQSLIQQTAKRLEPLVGSKGVLVVTAESQRELVQQHVPEACVLAEPVSRNTAPCVGFAAKYVLRTIGDVPMICLPADHVISGSEEILGVYRRAVEIARNDDVLVTIGIKPTRPETGYGYIRRGTPFGKGSVADAFLVKQFVEKPNQDTAERYVQSGEFFWNSGMFAWRPSVVLREIEKHLPQMAEKLEQIDCSFGTDQEYEQGAARYAEIDPVSVDVGVMERAEKVVMLSGDSFGWSDVGSWASWTETVLDKEGDQEQNVLRGDVLLLDSKGCTIVGDRKLIAGVGLENLIIVETEDALLVCQRDRSQDVKKVVDLLKEKNREEIL